MARVPLPQPDLHHRDRIGRRLKQGGGPHARLRVRPACIHADVRVERTHKEVRMNKKSKGRPFERINLMLDRKQLEKAMAVAIEGGKWQPTPVFLPEESHAGYSPWGRKELDTTEAT